MEEKLERNRAFWLDWKEKGLSTIELSLKYGLTVNSVHGLKRVLKLRGYNENGEPMKDPPRYYR